MSISEKHDFQNIRCIEIREGELCVSLGANDKNEKVIKRVQHFPSNVHPTFRSEKTMLVQQFFDFNESAQEPKIKSLHESDTFEAIV